jgi:hypothetical protein
MSLKTIKVNPIFLGSSGSSFGMKNKTRKEKPAGVSLGQANSIKKKLIARIKNFQQHSQQNSQQNNNKEWNSRDETPLNDAFGDSVQFLDNLARDKEEQKRERKNTSLKKRQLPQANAYMHIATELPPELDWNTIAPVKVQAPTMQAQPMQAQPMQAQQVQWQAAPQPSYGNLKKGGTKPTYRTWLRTTQKQKPVFKPSINILEDIEENPQTIMFDTDTKPIVSMSAPLVSAPLVSAPLVSAPLVSAPLVSAPLVSAPLVSAPLVSAPLVSAPLVSAPLVSAPAYIPSLKPRRKRITRTLKYKLGKHANGKVSVLIKNSQTRRKVQTEQALLKQKSILDIKNDLRSKNLLKVGSTAPSDVLRHLYEQSILAGQVENKAKETLIHNYFNEEKK